MSNQEKTVDWLRGRFIEFFTEREHKLYPSSSLVPAEDPSLLFTTAGMVQFKDNYVNNQHLDSKTATTIQKCLRTTDLDIVGTTDRHCTFFEMLGNFSFGGYFKREAIRYAWEFSRDVLEFPMNNVWVTVYEEDDEAFKIWEDEIGVPKERIVRLGKKDNYWGPAGDSGPCGPCSELYLDRGEAMDPGTKPGDDTDRFIEFWNLVFVGFFQDKSGNKTPLEHPGIDTGAGLERIVCLLQGVDSVYDTDEFAGLIGEIENVIGKKYSAETKVNFRVIADHIRSACFSAVDGALPSNEGRGYVIRRIIRRASLYGRKLGMEQAFLHKLVAKVVSTYGHHYPDLQKKQNFLEQLLLSEEERFLRTLASGLERLEELIGHKKKTQAGALSGKEVFQLYGTFGFPVELTTELAAEQGLDIDEAGFRKEMAAEQSRAQADWQEKQSSLLKLVDDDKLRTAAGEATRFIGYGQTAGQGKLLYYAQKDNQAVCVFDQTPFYAEGGGQTGDIGFARLGDETSLAVLDTQKQNDTYFHIVEIERGQLSQDLIGRTWDLQVDSVRRSRVAKNHSATHLLNAALRQEFGTDLMQTGSFVGDQYLRFDFNHGQALSDDELDRVEGWVNQAIGASAPVLTKEMPIDSARSAGAVANFGEKYGSDVRVVGMGSEPGADTKDLLSMELCGGTHVENTGDIGSFIITRETSPGAGNRRIEAVSGQGVEEHIESLSKDLRHKAGQINHSLQMALGNADISFQDNKDSIKIDDAELQAEIDKVFIPSSFMDQQLDALAEAVVPGQNFREVRNIYEAGLSRLREAGKSLTKLEKSLSGRRTGDLLSEVKKEIEQLPEQGAQFYARVFHGEDVKALKSLGDEIKRNRPGLAVGFINKKGDKLEVVVMCHPDLAAAGFHAGNVLKESLQTIGGRGGGKPDMAQGGAPAEGVDTEALATTLEKVAQQNLPEFEAAQ